VITRPDMVVRGAVRLIGPPLERRDECKDMVRRAIVECSESGNSITTVRWVSPSRDKREAANRLHEVLRRLRVVLFKDTNLDQDLRLLSPDQIDDWLKQAKAAGAETGKPIQLKARRKLIAAAQAIDLLEHFGKEISAQKGSPLCRLAAVLYGDPEADLQFNCRKALRKIRSNTI
jgi:hypothetical protein